jgi:flavodoxin/ferredoxin
MDKEANRKIKRFTLAYYSGTGCTKEVCDCFEKQLNRLELNCRKINIASYDPKDITETDFLLIFSPVYAFRLVSLVERWISNLPSVNNTSAAIISVSGGGEMSPNTACRDYSKRLLIKKGYNFIYEQMIVMPSNFAIQAEQQLNYNLINALPNKVNHIITDILSQKERLTVPKLQDRFFASIGRAEHFGAKFFGASIHASSNCNKCGLCVHNCPNKNIKMVHGLPKFGFRCLWCLKCIYACPCKALAPRFLKFSVLKNGFNLEKMKAETSQYADKIDSKPRKSILWEGVIDYLNND